MTILRYVKDIFSDKAETSPTGRDWLRIPERFRAWFDYLISPELDWIQVEVSSHCTASCSYCPHTVYQDSWLSRNMSMSTFERLIPAFKQTRLVHLQGWGEPLLNRDFFKMIAVAKQVGCTVGTSTNGMLLDEPSVRDLVKTGLDIIAFSLAGIDERNDQAREGTHLADILNAIRAISHEKRKASVDKPDIHIAYLLLRSALEDVRELPQVMQGLDVNQVVLTTLDFVPNEELAEEAIVPEGTTEYAELAAYLDEVVLSGRRMGLDIHYYLAKPGPRQQVCTENPQHALFVSSDGTVSPCVFTNLPVTDVNYQAAGDTLTYHPLIFGNVNDHSIGDIWRQKDYAAFRRSFDSGNLARPCRTCRKLDMIHRRQT